MKYLLATLAFLAAQSARADQLDDFENQVKDQTLERAFQLGDEIELGRNSCVAGKCDQFSEFFRVIASSEQKVTIQGRASDGHIVSNQEIAAADWDAAHHNYARVQISQLEGYGFKTTIKSEKAGSLELAVNGEKKIVVTTVVEIEGINGLGSRSHVTLEITAGLGGLAQVVRKTQDQFIGVDTNTVIRAQRPL